MFHIYDKKSLTSAFVYFAYCYNNSIFGMVLVILIPTLFSDLTLFEQKQYASLCFMAGFFSRPIGGLLFGLLGDSRGRDFALSISSLLLVFPTLAIALLPNDQYLNSFYLLILIASLRLVQGIGLGGSFSNSIVHISEHSNITGQYHLTGFMTSAGFFGASIATLGVFFAAMFLSNELSWRFSLLLGSIIGVVVYRVIKQDSEQFKSTNDAVGMKNLIKHFKKYRLILFISLLLGGLNLFPIYLATVYMNFSLVNYLGYNAAGVMLNNTVMFCLTGLFVLMSVPFLKKYGPFVILKATMVYYIVLAVPMYTMAYYYQSSLSLVLLQLFLLMGDGPMILSVYYLVPRLFPKDLRCSSVGISFTWGSALIGALAPLLASYCAHIGGTEVTVSLLLLLVSTAFLLIMFVLEKSRSYYVYFTTQVNNA